MGIVTWAVIAPLSPPPSLSAGSRRSKQWLESLRCQVSVVLRYPGEGQTKEVETGWKPPIQFLSQLVAGEGDGINLCVLGLHASYVSWSK